MQAMKGSSGLPRYLSQKPETIQEKISSMRKLESMKERCSRRKNSMKLGNKYSGAPLIIEGCALNFINLCFMMCCKFWNYTSSSYLFLSIHETCYLLKVDCFWIYKLHIVVDFIPAIMLTTKQITKRLHMKSL